MALKNYPSILPIWQPQGYSTHIIAKKVSELYGVKTSHTGTLDPMAEGVIIVLLGENRHKKYEVAKWIKGYEFEIAFGLETDSYDFLGLITNNELEKKIKISEEAINNTIKGFIGEYKQNIPPYSAIKVKGKPMHWYARKNKLDKIQIPTREGEINRLELTNLYGKNLATSLKQTNAQISKVTGNLRQDEIIEQWEMFLNTSEAKTIQVAKMYVEMTKGLYVRSLGVEIAQKVGTIGTTTNIKRTMNGIYNIENSKTLEEIFGKSFNEDFDFVSKQKKAAS